MVCNKCHTYDYLFINLPGIYQFEYVDINDLEDISYEYGVDSMLSCNEQLIKNIIE